MKTIKSTYKKALKFKKDNPNIDLSVFELCTLIAQGLLFEESEIEYSNAEIDVVRSMKSPFTASELAVKLYGESFTRFEVAAAAKMARKVTGKHPRKSNGKTVYDPIRAPYIRPPAVKIG